MPIGDTLEQSIIKWIAAFRKPKPEDITLESRLLHDLKIGGDDAGELLFEYSEIFGVDMSDFHFSEHFMGEPHLFNWWLPRDVSKFSPVTISDVVQAAIQKKWRA